MGAVLTQRPDIARAVVAAVLVMDSLRAETTTKRAVQYARVRHRRGSGDVHGAARILAFHNVIDGTAYSAVLLTAGENDTRVDAWHANSTS